MHFLIFFLLDSSVIKKFIKIIKIHIHNSEIELLIFVKISIKKKLGKHSSFMCLMIVY